MTLFKFRRYLIISARFIESKMHIFYYGFLLLINLIFAYISPLFVQVSLEDSNGKETFTSRLFEMFIYVYYLLLLLVDWISTNIFNYLEIFNDYILFNFFLITNVVLVTIIQISLYNLVKLKLKKMF